MATVWTKQIRWRDRDGGIWHVSESRPTRAEAEGAALTTAIQAGWTPARWWQWWRWGENR